MFFLTGYFIRQIQKIFQDNKKLERKPLVIGECCCNSKYNTSRQILDILSTSSEIGLKLSLDPIYEEKPGSDNGLMPSRKKNIIWIYVHHDWACDILSIQNIGYAGQWYEQWIFFFS